MDFTGFMGGGGGYSGSSSATGQTGDQGTGQFVGGSLNKNQPGNSIAKLIMVAAVAAAVVFFALKK